MEFKLEKHKEISYVRACIRNCQSVNHVQQVAYSTYHDCLTQVCFTCKRIRTSLKEKEFAK